MTDFTKPVQAKNNADGNWYDAVVCVESKYLPGTWMTIYHDSHGYLVTRGGGADEDCFRNKPEEKSPVPFTLATLPWTHCFRSKVNTVGGFTTISAATNRDVKMSGCNWMSWAMLQNEYLHAPHPNAPAEEWRRCETTEEG